MLTHNIEFIPKCLAIGFKRKSNCTKYISGDELFNTFVNANNYCYWNINLQEMLNKCELVGHIRPYCLLIRAADIYIQSLKLTYEKRLLKAPESFVINFIGDVNSVNCQHITPAQFVPLAEALCYVVFDLNQRNESSTFDVICCRLAEWYPGLQLPPQFLILATLRNLIDAGQVYYTGYGYNIMTSDKLSIVKWLEEPCLDDVTEKTELHTRSQSDRINQQDSPELEYNSHIRRSSQYSTSVVVPLDETNKKSKTRSSLWQFFSKLRPHNRQPRTSSKSSTLPNNNCDSNYFAFNQSKPTFYSSNLEFSHSTMKPQPDITPQCSKQQWLWHTSLQSLPIQSLSTNSQLSTHVIMDETPPRSFSVRKIHRSKSSSGRSKNKHKEGIGGANSDTVHEDSGVHSITESHDNIHGKDATKYFTNQSLDRSLDVQSDYDNGVVKVITPPYIRHGVKSHQRLPRSFSARLTSLSTNHHLGPVTEASIWDSCDDRNVDFKDNYGTSY